MDNCSCLLFYRKLLINTYCMLFMEFAIIYKHVTLGVILVIDFKMVLVAYCKK